MGSRDNVSLQQLKFGRLKSDRIFANVFIKPDLALLLTDKSSCTPKRIVAFHYRSPISTTNLLKTSNKTGKKNMFMISYAQPGTSNLTKLFGFQTWGRFCEMASRCEEFVNPRGATGARPERAAAREGGRSFFSCFVPSFALSYSIDDIRPEKSRKYGCELFMLNHFCFSFTMN